MNQQENGDIEVVNTQPEVKPAGIPPGMRTVTVGLDFTTGSAYMEKGDIPSWEMVIGILAAAMEVAQFHRNMGHGQAMQQRAMQMVQEQQIKQQLAQKGRLHT